MKTGAIQSAFAAAVILLLATVVVYWPVRHGGYLWDDRALIVDNAMVQAPDGLAHFWFTTEAPDYYPLTSSLYWLEWRMWGDCATGYHMINVLLHAVNALLVWWVLFRLNIPGAWLAALVFAVHPVNVATVGWVSEQKNTLSMLFYLLSLLAYLRFIRKKDWRAYSCSLVMFVLALLSKSAVVMEPVVLLLCVWWIRQRVERPDVAATLPFFALSLAAGLTTLWFQFVGSLHGRDIRMVGFAGRLATAGWIPWFYFFKAVLPVNLNVIYPKWEVDPGQWESWVPLAALAICFGIFWRRRETWGRAALFAMGYFVVMLFPVLGFFDQGFYAKSLVSDHWQYYSIVGVIALAVASSDKACDRIFHGRPPGQNHSRRIGLPGTGNWHVATQRSVREPRAVVERYPGTKSRCLGHAK